MVYLFLYPTALARTVVVLLEANVINSFVYLIRGVIIVLSNLALKTTYTKIF